MLGSSRGVPVRVGLADQDWSLDVAAVRAAVTPRTRAMVINTPSNPAGKVFTLGELEALAEIAEEFDLFCFTDEIYEHFIYGGGGKGSPGPDSGGRGRRGFLLGFFGTFFVVGGGGGGCISAAGE